MLRESLPFSEFDTVPPMKSVQQLKSYGTKTNNSGGSKGRGQGDPGLPLIVVKEKVEQREVAAHVSFFFPSDHLKQPQLHNYDSDKKSANLHI